MEDQLFFAIPLATIKITQEVPFLIRTFIRRFRTSCCLFLKFLGLVTPVIGTGLSRMKNLHSAFTFLRLGGKITGVDTSGTLF